MALLHKIVGVFLVLVGAVLTPTPIPIGLALLILGLALLAPYFAPVQRLIRGLREKNTRLDETLLTWRAKCPTVIQLTIDKTTP